jgi:hypothetical protein
MLFVSSDGRIVSRHRRRYQTSLDDPPVCLTGGVPRELSPNIGKADRRRTGFHIRSVRNPVAESTVCGGLGLNLDGSIRDATAQKLYAGYAAASSLPYESTLHAFERHYLSLFAAIVFRGFYVTCESRCRCPYLRLCPNVRGFREACRDQSTRHGDLDRPSQPSPLRPCLLRLWPQAWRRNPDSRSL